MSMGASGNTIHPALLEAARSATTATAELKAGLDLVAGVMERIHGGRWRVQIDHEEGFVLVARRIGRPEIGGGN